MTTDKGLKNKNIWIFHHYATPPNMSGLTRPYEFSKKLIERGYKATIFASAYLHYSSENIMTDRSIFKELIYDKVPFVFIKTTKYKKSKLLRVLNIFSYYFNALKVAKIKVKDSEKPDVIIGSSAHPLAALIAIKLGRRYGCKSIIEVRDLWPESFVAYDIIGEKNPLLKLLYAGEKWIYKNADKLIFTMEGGKDYIIEKGWDEQSGGSIDIDKVYHINNGVDLETFDYNKENYRFEDSDLDDPSTFKVVYAGSIRLVNNIQIIIDLGKVIKSRGINDFKILIFGDGSEKLKLEEYCERNKLKNVVFKGKVEKKYIPNILSRSDLNIFHFNQNSIKKYGGSLNKMFEYFASGKPTLSDCEFGYDLINRYKAGISKDMDDPDQIAEEVIKFYNMDKEKYNEYCSNALEAASQYDYNLLTEKLINIIGKYK